MKTTCDFVIAEVSVRFTKIAIFPVRDRLGIHDITANQRRGEAGTDAEQEPRRVGAVEPPSRPRITRHVPRPFPLHLHVVESRPPAPAAAGRQDRVPYRRRADTTGFGAAEEAGGGVVAARLLVMKTSVDPAG